MDVASLSPAQRRQTVRDHRPNSLSVAKACRVMEVARSSFYDSSSDVADNTAPVGRMHAIHTSCRLTTITESRRSCAPTVW